ncbi:unnamed protein product [Amoebophrya sp. A25]|nr:unnamed protein product [Amoebophrya sp. A25]|eukprot:GSA25T00020347001.1
MPSSFPHDGIRFADGSQELVCYFIKSMREVPSAAGQFATGTSRSSSQVAPAPAAFAANAEEGAKPTTTGTADGGSPADPVVGTTNFLEIGKAGSRTTVHGGENYAISSGIQEDHDGKGIEYSIPRDKSKMNQNQFYASQGFLPRRNMKTKTSTSLNFM